MNAPSAAQWLDVWERGLSQSPVRRALTLLALAFPQAAPDELARLSIGQRDARLFALREAMFGYELSSVTVCVACGEQLEMTLDVRDLCAAAPQEKKQTFTASIKGWHIEFRLPNSLDLAAAADSGDQAAAREAILHSCVLTARKGKRSVPPNELAPATKSALVAAMEAADPLAVMEMQLCCPTCARQWTTLFDIASYLWAEVHAWAQRLLGEVHVIASAYGWTETEIVNLSPSRRRAYLEMINA